MNLSERWLEAAKLLAADPTARVLCPKCRHYGLDVRDKAASGSHMERQLVCPECNAQEFIYMKKPV